MDRIELPEDPDFVIMRKNQAKRWLDKLSAEDRMEVFHDYCTYCGSKQLETYRCQCWNDE